jgi:2-oxoglutarate ferredoxin oxidoreductase subunit beta
MEGVVTKNQPFGVFSEQLNPMVLAVAHDCSFAARAFAGDGDHLKTVIMQAITHEGFSLVDILQPCVTFNKVNTYQWYKKRVYTLGPEHNPEDRIGAFRKALEWGDRIPLGVIYRNSRPALEKRIPILGEAPLVRQSFDPSRIQETLKEFF